MLHTSHPDEYVLEQYCMEKLEGPALERLEEHLLICAECQDRVTETDSFVLGMRQALASPAIEPVVHRWKILDYFRMPVPAWGAVAVAALALAGVFVMRNNAPATAPLAIALSATRGGAATVARTAGPLDLDLDARDLSSEGTYQMQIVNSDGLEVWSDSGPVSGGHLHALVNKRLASGQYFVRIADAAGNRREFALRLAGGDR